MKIIAQIVSILSRFLFWKHPLTIVTAADFSHGLSLFNFLESAKRCEPNTRVMVYDLGLRTDQLERIETAFDYEIRKFNFSIYPKHLNIDVNAGDYAWKAPVVKEVADEYGGLVCWMDAGNIIRYPLLRLRWRAITRGYFAQLSGGSISTWTHPGMISFFNLPPGWKADAPNFNTAGVIFNTKDETGRDLLRNWARFSMMKDCIAPAGSSRENHRQDQALFTVLAHQLEDVSMPRYRYPEFISHQDLE